jgi:hypothetical protein
VDGGDIALANDSYGNLFFLFKNFVLKSDAFFFFVEFPARFVELFIEIIHLHILDGDGVYKFLSAFGYFFFFADFLNILACSSVSFIDVVLHVAALDILPDLVELVDEKGAFGFCGGVFGLSNG